MSTRIVDRYGEPYPTREVRPCMGFLKGELDAEGSEPPTWDRPRHFEITELRTTSNGENDEPLMRRKR